MVALSVIIPCYNTKEEYLRNCIESIINQEFTDYEIIIIDDGSELIYSHIIDSIAIIDGRIKVFRQENQGVSAARNYGIIQATGKYVVFVDSDDCIVPFFFKHAYNIAEENNADIVYGFEKKGEEKSKTENSMSFHEIREVDNSWLKKNFLGFFYRDTEKFFGRGPVARIIKSDLARAVFFPEGVPLGEDVIWNLEVIKKAKRKFITDEVWYIYMDRDDSATCKYDTDIINRVAPFYVQIKDYLDGTDDDYYLYLNWIFRDLKKYIFKVYLGHKENEKSLIYKWREFNLICKEDPWKEICNGLLFRRGNMRLKIKYVLFRVKLLFPIWVLKNKIVPLRF